MSSLIMYTLREKYPETSHFKCLRVYLIIFVLIFISQGLFAQERQDPGHVHSDTRSMHKMKEYILEKERQLMEEMERQMEEIRNRYREEFMQRYDVPREEPLPDVPEATTTPEQIKPDDFELEERLRKMEQQMMEEMEEQYRYESIMPAQQTSFQTGPVDEQDSLALVALYNTMDGDNWDNNTNWLSEEPVSDWYGVVVQDDRVVRIELVWNSLSGVLPDEINNLDSLTYLNLGGNDLSGEFPEILISLENLKGLFIHNNNFTGHIPSTIDNLTNLESLQLGANNFTGSIPPEIGNLVNLDLLGLSFNTLTGYIPPEIGNLTNLTGLYLNDNNLNGTVPPEIGNLINLKWGLILYNNIELTGSLPIELINLTKLTDFRFFNTDLCEPTDDAFKNWINSVQAVYGNRIMCEVTDQDHIALVELYNSTDGDNWTDNTNWLSDVPVYKWHGVTVLDDRVRELRLVDNNLTGSISPELGNLSNLFILHLHVNNLTGSIPPELGNLTNLWELYLQNNNLGGSIPPEMGNLTNLRWLSLNNNYLNDIIPPELGNLSNLHTMRLDNNSLSGSIPSEIGSLENVVVLYLHNNDLSGTIPSELGSLENIVNLAMSGNFLSGSIPVEIGNMTSIASLWLHDNNLSGSIPSELNGLENLYQLYIHNNSFGSFPDISNLTNFTRLWIQNNRLEFESIEPNIEVPSEEFIYSPQANVGEARTEDIVEGESITMSFEVGGENNIYQWLKNNEEIPGATNDTYIIEAMTNEDAGNYVLRITNTVATDLTLYSQPITLVAEQETGTIADIDGNVYQTVKIGDQWWMAENLRTTAYADGTPIPTDLTSDEWINTISGAYTIYPHNDIDGINSEEEVLEAYGALYNWYAVDDTRGICPSGWLIPSDDEWTTLVDYLGGTSVAGGKMKSTQTDPDLHPRWDSPNIGATNESGFTGLPGGILWYETFEALGNFATFWSSTEGDDDNQTNRLLVSEDLYISYFPHSPNWGLSVRCIMETPSVELPTSPIIASPANNATGVGISPRLRWHESEHATSYTIYITDNNGFDVDVSDIPDTSYYVTGLEHDTEYQWKVRAWNESGYSDWSETFTFTTISPPQAEETKTAPEGDNSTVEYDSGLQFTGDVQTSSNVTVKIYETTPYPGDNPPAVFRIGDFYILISGNGLEFTNGYLRIPLSQIPVDVDPDDLTWLKRSASGDAWEDLGGEVDGDYFVNTIPFDSFSEFSFGRTGVLTYPATVATGWNLIGLPLDVFDYDYKALYPGAIDGTLYAFDGSYQSKSELEPGFGYWLRFSEGETVDITGVAIDELTLSLSTGWNMISGLSATVPLSSVLDQEGILIPGTLYGFDGSYQSSDALEPGKGYWMRANAAGEITLTSADGPDALASVTQDAALGKVSGVSFLEQFDRIEIRGAGGIEQTLYFGNLLPEGVQRESYSLPPLPPGDAFDVRFADGYYVSEESELTVMLRGDSYPFELRFDSGLTEGEIEYVVTVIKQGSEGIEHSVADGGSIEIADAEVNVLKVRRIGGVADRALPEEFNLSQNYPNPFNPVTTIQYALPKDTNVRLEVYNILGQRVQVLVDEHQEAGYYDVTFDGSQVTSGVYVYRIMAGEFVDVKKLVYLK